MSYPIESMFTFSTATKLYELPVHTIRDAIEQAKALAVSLHAGGEVILGKRMCATVHADGVAITALWIK